MVRCGALLDIIESIEGAKWAHAMPSLKKGEGPEEAALGGCMNPDQFGIGFSENLDTREVRLPILREYAVSQCHHEYPRFEVILTGHESSPAQLGPVQSVCG